MKKYKKLGPKMKIFQKKAILQPLKRRNWCNDLPVNPSVPSVSQNDRSPLRYGERRLFCKKERAAPCGAAVNFYGANGDRTHDLSRVSFLSGQKT